MLSPKAKFTKEIREFLQDTLRTVNQAIERDSNTQQDVDYLLSVIEFKDLSLKHNAIMQIYDEYVQNIDEYCQGDNLGIPIGLLRPYIHSCRKSIMANVVFYSNRYKAYIESISSNRSGFDQIVTFKPRQAISKFNMLFEKVDHDFEIYNSGRDFVENAEEFSNWLLEIVRLSRASAAFISICIIALKKYKAGDIEGSRLLMNRALEDPTVKELENFDYVDGDDCV
ncbi:hypothetical protein H4219_006111 [Mycoemilia scoparia]|uniref:Uncharacterized protein n=1 Tax=Mycoemilia scoparia TaxID=417184 RepID=A0A9W7ZL43_9FUNG|nr:hypothetical protein H4219_006111 [Mycoemilia scoparia]